MANVTEAEILALLRQQFRLSAEYCDALAILPARGPTYRKFRESLKIVENCCRQVAYYRQDARWFRVGLQMEEAHRRAGHWLRRHSPRPLFVKLADNLRAGAAAAERLETAATGRVGMILPRQARVERTEGRPMQVMSAPHQRLILPPQV